MKRIFQLTGLFLTMLFFLAFAVKAEQAETLTLAQLLKASPQSAKTVSIVKDMAEAKTQEQAALADFFEAAEHIVLVRQQENQASEDWDGYYITVEKTDGTISYAYITETGAADVYSLFMSRLPGTPYLAADAADAWQRLGALHKAWTENEQNRPAEAVSPQLFQEYPQEEINVTRGRFCGLAGRLLEHWGSEAVNTAEFSFTDTDSEAVRHLWEAGIVRGKDDTHFAPEEYLTREEAAVLLSRLVDFSGGRITPSAPVEISDFNEISEWAQGAAGSIIRYGIMTEEEKGKFVPQGTYTVQQAMKSLQKLADLIPTKYEPVETKEIGKGLFYQFNYRAVWIADQEKVLFERSMRDHHNLMYFQKNGDWVIAALKKDLTTEFYSLLDGRLLFSVPYSIHTITEQYIITYKVEYTAPTVDAAATAYGVYDFEGNMVLETKYSLDELREKGYL